MKRVAGIAAAAVAVAICLWVMGTEVGADRLFVFFVVVLATLFAIDFVNRRTTGAGMVSAGGAGVAAGVLAGGVTIVAWTAAEMAGLEHETGVYLWVFAPTFVVHWLGLRLTRWFDRRVGR